MQPTLTVAAFKIHEHVRPRVIARGVFRPLHEFAFQRGKEALHRRGVQAIALAAHGTQHSMMPQTSAIAVPRILHAAVGMMHQAERRPLAHDGHIQRGQRQFMTKMLGHSEVVPLHRTV
jgi:hypothetical protein